MRDVRTVLGLPPVAPDVLQRFGPPTYTEAQVLAYAAAVGPLSSPSIALAVHRLTELAQRLGGIANLTLHGDGKVEVAADIRVVVGALTKPAAQHDASVSGGGGPNPTPSNEGAGS